MNQENMQLWLNHVLIHVSATILTQENRKTWWRNWARINCPSQCVNKVCQGVSIYNWFALWWLNSRAANPCRKNWAVQNVSNDSWKHALSWLSTFWPLDALHWGIKQALEQHWVTGLMHQPGSNFSKPRNRRELLQNGQEKLTMRGIDYISYLSMVQDIFVNIFKPDKWHHLVGRKTRDIYVTVLPVFVQATWALVCWRLSNKVFFFLFMFIFIAKRRMWRIFWNGFNLVCARVTYGTSADSSFRLLWACPSWRQTANSWFWLSY